MPETVHEQPHGSTYDDGGGAQVWVCGRECGGNRGHTVSVRGAARSAKRRTSPLMDGGKSIMATHETRS
jgi:hypothetical protein